MKPLIFQLKFDKETKNKLRWKKIFPGGSSELHIPKWRVPENIPDIIMVEIQEGQLSEIKRYSEVECKIRKERKNDPIYENLKFNEEFGHTYSYIPLANKKERYFDFFHIPKEMLSARFEFLNIKAWWNF